MSRTKTELMVAGWSAITFGALLASIMVSRPVRDALALEGDPDQIPWLFSGTFVTFLVVVPVWGTAVAKNPRKLVPRVFHVSAACAVVFSGLLRSEVAPIATGYAFYIWSSVMNMLVVSAFWSLLADLFDPATARKLYGPISAGGTIGAFAGPLLTRVLVEYFDVAMLFLVIALCLELAVVGVHQVKRHGATLLLDPERERPLPPDAWAGLKQIVRSRYLAVIAGFVLCTATAATFIYLAQADIVKTELANKEERTELFATIDMWTQGLTFVVQMLLARPLLGWLGPGLVLCVLPLVQGAGILVLVAAPTVTTLVVVQVLSRTATHGLTRPARELLFTAVDRDDKYRAKNVIDTLVLRFGDFAASWLYTGLVAMSAGAAMLSIAAIPLTLGWLVLALVLGAGFRHRVKRSTEPS